MTRRIIGDDGQRETLCRHGVGHPNPANKPPNASQCWGTHTCCIPACCRGPVMFEEDAT